MKEIIDSINRLSNSYRLLSENTDQIFNTLKVKDYKKKEVLEMETQLLYKEKDLNEMHLIEMVKTKADSLGLEDKRIERILEESSDKELKMEVEYELEKMVKNIHRFQLNLKRNIEFAAAFMETKGKEIEVMFDVIQREQIQQGGPLLLNEEL